MINVSRYRSFFVMGSIFLVLLQVAAVGKGFSGELAGRADFGSFYAGGYLIRAGHGEQIYDFNKTAATEAEKVNKKGANLPYIHPAYEGLLFAVLSLFSYQKAFALFFVFNLCLLVMVYWLLRPAAAWMGEIWSGLPALTMAGFLPVGVCLIQGQDSILLLAILAGSYVLQERRRDFWSGLVLGLGMFRFQLVVPLVVCLCFARKWKMLAGFAAACAAVATISVRVTEPASWMEYPRHLVAMNAGLQAESEKLAHAIYPEKMPNLRGFFYLLLGTSVSAWTLQVLTALSSVALLGWAIWKRLPFELLVVVAVLASYHGAIHDSVLLLLPLLKCSISSVEESGKRLLVWSAVLVSPTLALFTLHVPFAAMSLVYLAFLVVMAPVTAEVGKRLAAGASERMA